MYYYATLNNFTKKIHFIFPSAEIADSIAFSRLDLIIDWYKSEFQVKKIDNLLPDSWLSNNEVIVYAVDQEQVDSFVALVKKLADETGGSFNHVVLDLDPSKEDVLQFNKSQVYDVSIYEQIMEGITGSP